MVQILKEYGITDNRERYNLSKAQGHNLADYVGQRIEVKAYLIVETTNDATGAITKSLKIMTPENEVIGTISRAFIDGFLEFTTFMDSDAVGSFEVEQKTAKNGRKYLSFLA